MKPVSIDKIDLGRLSNEIGRYEKQWIAISPTNTIIAHGKTYQETMRRAKRRGMKDIVLFKVPPLAYSLSP